LEESQGNPFRSPDLSLHFESGSLWRWKKEHVLASFLPSLVNSRGNPKWRMQVTKRRSTFV